MPKPSPVLGIAKTSAKRVEVRQSSSGYRPSEHDDIAHAEIAQELLNPATIVARPHDKVDSLGYGCR